MSEPAVRAMSFWSHLSELRLRLVISVVAMLVFGCAAYFWRQQVYALLLYPLTSAAPGVKLNFFTPTEPFFVYLRISTFCGIAAGAPVALYQLWAFIAPGLTPRERRLAGPILPLILALFTAGVVFIWFALLPVTLKFLIGMAPEQLMPTLSQERYFSFVTAMCLAGGLLFELPAVLGLAGFLGFVNAPMLWRYFPHATVILLIVSAVITPTGDAFTMLAMTAPMLALYLLSIGVVWIINRRRKD